MDLARHLRQFLVVAEEMHFGRAAEILGIAQPPLSQAIQRLERELGVELFDRSRRQVSLTTAGQLLLVEAPAMLSAEERIRVMMRKAGEGEIGTLRAGVPPETPAVTLQALLTRMVERAPGLDVDLHELTSAEQLRMLAEARLDVGLVHHPVEVDELRFGSAVTVRLGVVLPRASPLAQLREVTLADLTGHDLVLFPRATAPGWHDEILDVCRRSGFTPRRIRHARNPDFLLGLVLGRHCVTFEPESTARREPRVAWRPLAEPVLSRRTSAVWPVRSPHPAAGTFAQVATEILGGPAPTPPVVVAPDRMRPWSIVYTPSDVRDDPGRSHRVADCGQPDGHKHPERDEADSQPGDVSDGLDAHGERHADRGGHDHTHGDAQYPVRHAVLRPPRPGAKDGWGEQEHAQPDQRKS
ncbi:DNA-binding transcriptional LysR family regulator [Micromonospora pisi]|uniref:DNA-binding transcriptional LysR family regulator n=1 Tax=Micromonospora pisi TaxID=589240 RepID=A0A495JSK2_9ACTN|nr:LysR family transcriptional regulator [Micromonospora pisi]RKR91980.1 DNA-binding transcriptional LysR family regulator [Micromonospora pisi]